MARRYGLIGCGMMGREHIKNVNLLPGAQISYVYDPVSALAEQAAQLAGGASCVASLADLVLKPDLEALIIASPNFVHAQQLRQIAQLRTLPILCEKPLYTRTEDAELIGKLQTDYAAPIWVAMEYRFMPPLAAFIQRAQTVTGGIDMLSLREHRYPFLEKIGNWNRLNKYTGGTLVEKCCHFFDLMRLILKSEPVRVMASAGQRNNHLDETYEGQTSDIWDTGYIVFDFDNGARALLELCMYADGSLWNEEISAVGQTAKLECRIPGPKRFWPAHLGAQPHAEITESPRHPKGPSTEPFILQESLQDAGDHHGSTYFQHQRFLDLVCGRIDAPDVTLEDGKRAVQMGLAAQRAATTRTVVTLSEFG